MHHTYASANEKEKSRFEQEKEQLLLHVACLTYV